MPNSQMLEGSGTDRSAMASVKSLLSPFGTPSMKGVVVAVNIGEVSRPL